MRTLARLAACLLAAAPAVAPAHGGEDHGAPPGPPSAHSDAGVRTAYAQSEVFELTIKLPAQDVGAPAPLRLFLADFATNAPIEGAQIEIEFSTPDKVTVRTKPGEHPGSYAAETRFPTAGSYEGVASISAGDRFDLLPVKSVEVGPPSAEGPGSAVGSAGGRAGPWIFGAAALGSAAAVLTAVLRKRASPREARKEEAAHGA